MSAIHSDLLYSFMNVPSSTSSASSGEGALAGATAVSSGAASSAIDQNEGEISSDQSLYPQYNQNNVDLYDVLLKSNQLNQPHQPHHSSSTSNTPSISISASESNHNSISLSPSPSTPTSSAAQPNYYKSTGSLDHLANFKYISNNFDQITINPKELNSNDPIANDYCSISSMDDDTTFNAIDDSNENDTPKTKGKTKKGKAKSKTPNTHVRKHSNWSMNEEVENAIQIWINENQKNSAGSAPVHTTRKYERKNSLTTSSTPRFVKSSTTKRRKSDSLISNPVHLSNIIPSLDSLKSNISLSSSEVLQSSANNLSLNSSVSPANFSLNSTAGSSSSLATSSMSPPASSAASSASTKANNSSSLSARSLINGHNNILKSENRASKSPSIDSLKSSSTTSTTTASTTAHLINDDAEKPFKCDDCPKAFRRSEHLKRHIRSVHSNIRPFPCKFCDKKFSRSDNLAQHLRTHNRH